MPILNMAWPHLSGYESIQIPHPVLIDRSRGFRGLGTAPQVLDQPTVDAIAAQIQKQEGYYPGSVAYQNNNPGNLVYAGQSGAIAGSNGFAVFPDYQSGLVALDNQIQLYASRGMSIQDMMNVYAPAGQGNNDPQAYAASIANALGVTPGTQLTDISLLAGNTSPGDGVNIDPSSSLMGGSSIDWTTLAWIGVGALGLLAMAEN